MADRKGPTGNARFGHYAFVNSIPSAYEGTFRTVYEEKPLPSPGAMDTVYSTFMFPFQPLQGAGQPLTRGTPDPRSPTWGDEIPMLVLPATNPPAVGTFQHYGLLPPLRGG